MMRNELKHYGVKGMKWGVRKQRPGSGKRKGKANAQRIYEAVKNKKTKKEVAVKPNPKSVKKSVRDMSDEELRSAINRLQMERTYAQLTAKEVSKGRKFVSEVLYNSAKTTATKVTSEAMMNLVKRVTRSGSGGGGGNP